MMGIDVTILDDYALHALCAAHVDSRWMKERQAQYIGTRDRRKGGKRSWLRLGVWCGVGIGVGILGVYCFMVYSTMMPIQQNTAAHHPRSHAPPRHQPSSHQTVVHQPRASQLAVRWEMECGCTGMEVEARY